MNGRGMAQGLAVPPSQLAQGLEWGLIPTSYPQLYKIHMHANRQDRDRGIVDVSCAGMGAALPAASLSDTPITGQATRA